MLKYSQIINEKTGLVNVAEGTNIEFYKSIGMVKRDVEQSDVDNNWYLAEKCPHKSEEEKEKEEQDRINNLTMTPLDFIKVLEVFGLTLSQINGFLESNLEIKTQLTYCNLVYCGVVKQFLPIEIEGITITPQMVEEAFKTKNGVF